MTASGKRIAAKLRIYWDSHRTQLLRLAVSVMGLAASVWLAYQFWRLLWAAPPIWPSSLVGGIDLSLRHGHVQAWFSGQPMYWHVRNAVEPPASYLMLWPLLGWPEVTSARWLFAATAVVALGWLVYAIVRESGADDPLERIFVVLMPLSMYATGAAIGNGQLVVFIVPMLVTGLLMLQRGRGAWRRDLWAAALIVMAMVKPSIAAPFFWIVLFVPRRLRPVLLVVLGYVALTLVAASFQQPGLPALLVDWATQAARVSVGMARVYGTINLHSWAAALGLEAWNFPLSLLALAGLGWWTYRRRDSDPWLLLGVTALVARLWTYHGWYDDLLILLPMIALFRMAKGLSPSGRSDVVAGALLVLSMATQLAPGGLYLLPAPWNSLYVAAQTLVWIAVLVFLLERGRRLGWRRADRKRTAGSHGGSRGPILADREGLAHCRARHSGAWSRWVHR